MNGTGDLTILLMAFQDVQVKIPTACVDEIVNRGRFVQARVLGSRPTDGRKRCILNTIGCRKVV
jgi:hypothetical protein